jgi:hypothetical protein
MTRASIGNEHYKGGKKTLILWQGFAFSVGHCLLILLYWGGNEIRKIKDDSKIHREKNIIAAVRNKWGQFERFPTSLLSRCRLPLKRLKRLKMEWQKSPAGTRQTDGKNLVWFGEIGKKISQIIKDYFYLPLFLLIILWNYLKLA